MSADTDELTTLRSEIARLREALRMSQRMSELAAEMIRDKRRTRAYGAVADMVERIACHFDRIASRARSAIAEDTQ